jgi:hypothetical protein
MGRAKDIIVKVIPSKIANEFVKKHHYSGKVATTGRLHFGCFLDGKLHGVLTYGSSIDKSKVLPFVKDTGWNEYLELNRMAFDSRMPRNSESRCISITIKLIRKNAPHVKWILSFADGCQCGDGTIYRASGFILTAIKKNTGMWMMPDGEVVADIITRQKWNDSTRKRLGFAVGEKWSDFSSRVGAERLNGYQLRYIYLIDKSCELTVPILPFSQIDEMGAGMYKGKKITLKERRVKHSGDADNIQLSEGGSIPTDTLQMTA